MFGTTWPTDSNMSILCAPLPKGIWKGVQVGVETAGQWRMNSPSFCETGGEREESHILCLSAHACKWVPVNVHCEFSHLCVHT